jgi:membrane fusion protein
LTLDNLKKLQAGKIGLFQFAGRDLIMTSRLFRVEVLAAKSTQWAGTIVLARPVSLRLATLVSTLFAVALALYLLCGEYTRKVHVSGHLMPDAGALRIIAPQFGQISRCLVHEGDSVAAGQVLYELSTERSNARGGIDARIDSSLATRRDMLAQELQVQNRQLAQRATVMGERRVLLLSELSRLEQEVQLQNRRIVSANDSLKRYETLRQQGFVSEIQFSQVDNDRTDQLARLQALERARLTSQRELLQLADEVESATTQMRLNDAQTRRSLAALDQEDAEHQGRHLQILAPSQGVVTALAAEPGQSVASGAALATLIPGGSQLEAHLLAPSRAVGFIEPEQEVLLQLSAFPYQKFGQIKGRVLRVERSPTPVAEGTEPVYKVTVRLSRQSTTAYGRERPYRAGMAIDADIKQDRRRLIEWVFDPIISAAKHRSA